jgi:hypothetical protein
MDFLRRRFSTEFEFSVKDNGAGVDRQYLEPFLLVENNLNDADAFSKRA